MFASRTFVEKSMCRPYCGWLPYANFERELQSGTLYEEEFMKATAGLFRKWAVELKGKVSDSKGQECSV